MRTTLNLPDVLVAEAKLQALKDRSTLTDLLVEGLQMRLEKARTPVPLPVSKASGGLVSGSDWMHLDTLDPREDFR